jgi:hypothetical protein
MQRGRGHNVWGANPRQTEHLSTALSVIYDGPNGRRLGRRSDLGLVSGEERSDRVVVSIGSTPCTQERPHAAVALSAPRDGTRCGTARAACNMRRTALQHTTQRGTHAAPVLGVRECLKPRSSEEGDGWMAPHAQPRARALAFRCAPHVVRCAAQAARRLPRTAYVALCTLPSALSIAAWHATGCMVQTTVLQSSKLACELPAGSGEDLPVSAMIDGEVCAPRPQPHRDSRPALGWSDTTDSGAQPPRPHRRPVHPMPREPSHGPVPPHRGPVPPHRGPVPATPCRASPRVGVGR